MKRAMLLRPGHALGDAVFVTPIPRLLKEKEGYDVVHVACQNHNFDVFKNNPYIDEMIEMPRLEDGTPEWQEEFQKTLATYDHTYEATGHVEMGLLQRTDGDWGTIPSGQERQEKSKGVNYQDWIYKGMGLDYTGLKPEFYFSDEEKAQIKALQEQLKIDNTKLVLWNWEGSSKSKCLTFGPMYLEKVLKRHQHSTHYVFSQSPDMCAQVPEHPRAHNAWGGSTIRNTIMMCSVASMVIGPESFLVNAAGAFDTPKMVFFSHSLPDNLARYWENTIAVVPDKEVGCHPCYLIHVDFRNVYHPEKRAMAREYERNCQTTTNKNPYRLTGYKCCFYLPHDQIVDNIVSVLKKKK